MDNYNLIKNTSKIYKDGSKWISKKSGVVTVIGKTDRYYQRKDGYKNYEFYLCRFEDGTIIESSYTSLLSGCIMNPNTPTVFDIGYLGQGKHVGSIDSKPTREYSLWGRMLERCYSEKYQKRQPTYIGVLVDSRWHSFQNFCDDIEQLAGYHEWKDGKTPMEIDKDILCKRKQITPKIYSKDTCMFVTVNENNDSEYRVPRLSGLTYLAHRISDGYEEEFINQRKFAEKWDLSNPKICKCVKGEQRTHRGWVFEVKED